MKLLQIGRISVLAIFLPFLCLSCITITAQFEGSSALLTIRDGRDTEVLGDITSRYLPAAVVTGEIEETEKGLYFYAVEIALFSEWPNGWTEGSLECSGTFFLEEGKDGWTFHKIDELSLWDVSTGAIRYYDTYYRGDDGLRKVKHRMDRMREVNKFLIEEKKFPPINDWKGFSKDAVSYLFPETKRLFRRKDRKHIFSETNNLYESSARDRVLGADIYWNTGYTDKILPEHLVPLRNSGTLWRDYEEAGSLFFSLYNIEYFFNDVLAGAVLKEKK